MISKLDYFLHHKETSKQCGKLQHDSFFSNIEDACANIGHSIKRFNIKLFLLHNVFFAQINQKILETAEKE